MSNEEIICILLNTLTYIFCVAYFRKRKPLKVRHYTYAHDISFILRELRTS